MIDYPETSTAGFQILKKNYTNEKFENLPETSAAGFRRFPDNPPLTDHNIFEFQIENEAGTCVGENINTAPATNYEFKIEFPEQIDVQTKALLMGATMLAVNKVYIF